MSSEARGNVIVDVEECKGCGLCVESCPPECLELAPELSKYGVHPAHYTGEGCSGCGACYYCCPEPGAITVERLLTPHRANTGRNGDPVAAAPKAVPAAVLPKPEVGHAAVM